MYRVVLSVFILFLCTGPGWTQAPKPAVKPAAASSDVQIEKSIQARFAKSKISVNKFQVRVQGGVATLEGKTDILQHKGTATRLAKLGGARQVRNRIEVSEKAREKAASNLDEGRRRAQVKRGEARTEARSHSQ